MCLATLAPTLETAVSLTPGTTLPMTVAAGLLVNLDKIPSWFFFKWISPYRYAFSALAQNEFDNNSALSHTVSHDSIAEMNFRYEYWEDVWILAVLFVLYRFLALFICIYSNRRKG